MIEHLDDAESGLPTVARQTPWPQLERLDLSPGNEHVVEAVRGRETGYLVLSGDLRLAPAGLEVTAPAALRCPVGAAHNLRAGPEGARTIAIGVQSQASGGAFAAEPFARDRLAWRDAIHGGGGRIATRHLWGPDDFGSSWTFVDHAILAQGSSLGCHYHDHMDEMFVVLSGRGWMTISNTTHEIGPGHVTFQAANEDHGLYNPYAEDLDFVRVAVATPGQTFTTIDLDDDLRARRPAPETTT
jgi:mannose-6-phosphate isomerase-like protein (cupin superfamily)